MVLTDKLGRATNPGEGLHSFAWLTSLKASKKRMSFRHKEKQILNFRADRVWSGLIELLSASMNETRALRMNRERK